MDLVTVAQALHWLERERFYSGVDRVIAPGGALAIVTYASLRTEPAIQELVHHFQNQAVGSYWPPERELVESGFAGLTIPIEEVEPPRFSIEADLTLRDLLGYIGTWSAVGRYRSERGQDPMPVVASELASVWGDPDSPKRIEWPLVVRAGRWKTF